MHSSMHRQGDPGVELEDVVRDPRSDLLHRAETAAALLDHLEALELEDVVAVGSGSGSAERGTASSVPSPPRVELDHEAAAGPLPASHGRGLPPAIERGARLEQLARSRSAARRRTSRPARADRPTRPTGTSVVLVRHSTISSMARRSPCAPPARTSVRSARAMRPPRPITRPRSSEATWSRMTSAPSSSTSSTLTWSSCSTSLRARYSTSSPPSVSHDVFRLQQARDRIRRLRALREPVLHLRPRRTRSARGPPAGCSGRRSR